MTPHDILTMAQARSVILRLESGRLRYSAPAGAMDDDLRAAIAAHRDDLIALLTQYSEHGTGALVHAEKGRAPVRAPVQHDALPPDSCVKPPKSGLESSDWCTGARENGSVDRNTRDDTDDTDWTSVLAGSAPPRVQSLYTPENACTSAPVPTLGADSHRDEAVSTSARTGAGISETCTSAPVDQWRIVAPMPGTDTPIRSCDCPRAHRVNCLTRVDGITQWICLRCHAPVSKLARLPVEERA